MKSLNIPQDKLKYLESLGIKINSNYFRTHYRNGLLDHIDEHYINEVQDFYQNHYNRTIDPITHIAYTNFTGKKDVRILPQRLFRKEFLLVFNDNPLTDIYRDKSLYESMFDTQNQAYNIIKRVRGQYYNNSNESISYLEAFHILLNDSKEYIIKPSDTNNGIGIKKIVTNNGNLYIDNHVIDSDFLDQEYKYNFVIQRMIRQHPNMAYLHPASVNTLRMATLRWKGEIENIFSFARFGHSGDIKDNTGSDGIVVGIKSDGSFMDYGVQDSKKIHIHPTTHRKISNLTKVPNFNKAKIFTRSLHRQVLHHNFVAWDISINEKGIPIFIEANFFGSSWTNQIALSEPMLGEYTDKILDYISAKRGLVNQLNTKSLAQKIRMKSQRRVNRFKKELRDHQKKLSIKENELKEIKKRVKAIKDSKSWRYTKMFRRR